MSDTMFPQNDGHSKIVFNYFFDMTTDIASYDIWEGMVKIQTECVNLCMCVILSISIWYQIIFLGDLTFSFCNVRNIGPLTLYGNSFNSLLLTLPKWYVAVENFKRNNLATLNKILHFDNAYRSRRTSKKFLLWNRRSINLCMLERMERLFYSARHLCLQYIC